MNTRIKEVRKAKKMTLEEFGEVIGLKKSAMSHIESGKNSATDRTVMLICKEFNVNEEWLRTGEGEMFNPMDFESELARLTVNLFTENSESFKRRFVSALARLTEDQWELLEEIAEQITKKE